MAKPPPPPASSAWNLEEMELIFAARNNRPILSPPSASSSQSPSSPPRLNLSSSSSSDSAQIDVARLDMLCREEFGFKFPKLKDRLHQQSDELQSLLHAFSEEVLETPDPADRRDLAKTFILRILEINQFITAGTIRTLVKMQSAFLENMQKEKDQARSELGRCKTEAEDLKLVLQSVESEKESIEAEARERFEKEKAILEVSLREELQACQICEVKPRNIVIMPCMHGQYCADCLESQQKTNKTCPSCRGVIRGMIPYIA